MAKEKRSRIAFYLGLNFMAPGVAQLALKWWFRGIVQFVLGLSCFFWFLWEMSYPIIISVWRLLSDSSGYAEIEKFNFIHLGLALIGLIIIWIWSFIDLWFNYVPKKVEETDESKQDIEEQ